jgi:hypothetical protein
MSSLTNPEAAQPTSTLSYEQSNRNPQVRWTGTDSDGGQIASPSASESRVTTQGKAASPNAGLQNYDIGDTPDSAEDEAEREG